MRNIINIDKSWHFKKDCGDVPKDIPQDWEILDLPHTWNGIDGQDGGNDYFRGKCCYVKELAISDLPEGQEVYVQFDGVNSSAEVYFNGVKLASHDGGYSSFRVKLSDVKDSNVLAVIADNSPNDRVYPQMADFTFYGGIYRDVTLIGVAENHFDLDYYGVPGIAVTPIMEGNTAKVTVNTYVKASGGCVVRYDIVADGKVIDSLSAPADNSEVTFTIENAHKWNGVKDPYLYTARAALLRDDREEDEISARFGCRSYKIDPQRGFILNGEEYPLRGVCRHQDRPNIGNALKPEHHREDVELICEVGANTIRLAHYQQSQYFYDLCDEKGLAIWAEIPYISRHMDNGFENTRSQLRELILQSYNHPSIIVWGISNEITMNGNSPALLDNHKSLNDLAHQLDKTRPTTLAVVSMCGIDDPYVHLTDVVSYNHYFGWYGGTTSMNGSWFDDFHKKYPNRPIGLSEYGCEALDWHSSKPEQGDYTEEYQSYYHEELIKQIMDRPYLWATHVWNMFDFAADARNEGGENGMNHKGLITFDRKYKKDSFYAYKAWLSNDPFVHICGKRYVKRVEDTTKVTVYSNQDEVELFSNGVSVGKQKKGKYPFFYFEVKNEGKTTLTAKAGECGDASQIEKVDVFPEEYRLKEEGAVVNWFELAAPEGYLSVNDTIGAVMSTFKGKLFLLKFIKVIISAMSGGKNEDDKSKKSKKDSGATVAGFKINKSLIEMAKGFTVKRALTMIGANLAKEQIISLNESLNKIKKK